MVSASSTKISRHIIHCRTSACTDPEVKRCRVMVLTFATRMGRDAEQRECACRYDCTLFYMLTIFIYQVATGAVKTYICPASGCMSIRLHISLVLRYFGLVWIGSMETAIPKTKSRLCYRRHFSAWVLASSARRPHLQQSASSMLTARTSPRQRSTATCRKKNWSKRVCSSTDTDTTSIYKVAASVCLCLSSGFLKNVKTDFHETFHGS